MASVTLDIPNERLEELKQRAERIGLSVDELLIRETERLTAGSTSTEFWNRLKNLPRVDIGMSGADAVREAREEHDREVDEWLSRR